jgi:hypothetical protein
MDEENRRDDSARKRMATEPDEIERDEDQARRREESRRNEQLTRREREERWPVG